MSDTKQKQPDLAYLKQKTQGLAYELQSILKGCTPTDRNYILSTLIMGDSGTEAAEASLEEVETFVRQQIEIKRQAGGS